MIDPTVSAHYVGDCREMLKQLPDGCVQTCVTSPPYWGLRDYGHEGQIGLESTPEEYVATMVEVFREVRRALRDDGTLWLNLGDSYATNPSNGRGRQPERAGLANGGATPHRSAMDKTGAGIKTKDLVGIPWTVALALRSDGWYLRADIIWSKPNAMPSPVSDRTTGSHEYVFLLAKSRSYFYDSEAIAEDAMSDRPSGNGYKRDERLVLRDPSGNAKGSDVPWSDVGGKRNARSVWTIATQPYDGAHFAVMPSALAERCVLAGSAPGTLVLDPFAGSGTTLAVAEKHGRRWIGFDLGYENLAKERTAQRTLALDTTPRAGGV